MAKRDSCMCVTSVTNVTIRSMEVTNVPGFENFWIWWFMIVCMSVTNVTNVTIMSMGVTKQGNWIMVHTVPYIIVYVHAMLYSIVIEDEYHFFSICPCYKSLRDTYKQNINKNLNFNFIKLQSTITLNHLTVLLNSSLPVIIKITIQYINDCFLLRTSV